MTTTKIATVTITETRTAFEVLAAGTYRVEMPADYDAATVTGEDILYDNAIRIVDDEDDELNHYAIIANRGSDTAEAIEVWTSLHDSGHPDVIAEAQRRVSEHGGFGRVTWVHVEEPCEAGDTLDVSDDGAATVL